MNAPFLAFLTWLQRWLLLAVLLALLRSFVVRTHRKLGRVHQGQGRGGIMALQFAGSADRAAHLPRRLARPGGSLALADPLGLPLPAGSPWRYSRSPARCWPRGARQPLPTIGIFVAWLALAAIPLDAIENLATLRMIDHGGERTAGAMDHRLRNDEIRHRPLTAAGYLLVAGIATLFQR